MACCVFTAFFMKQIINACEALDFNLIEIKYNDFDGEGSYIPQSGSNTTASGQIAKITITGMTCSACSSVIEKALLGLEGVERASVSLTLQRATILFNTERICQDDVISAVEESGYGAQFGNRTSEQNLEILQHKVQLKMLRESFREAVVLSTLLITLEKMHHITPYSFQWMLFMAAAILGTWIQLYNARWIHTNAWSGSHKFRLSMDTLISLSLILGVGLSVLKVLLNGFPGTRTYFSSGSFLVMVITSGRYLNVLLQRKNVANFASLFRVQAENNLVKVRHQKEPIPAALLVKGEEIYVEPGSVVPCDCFVIEGSSTVDQSTMTGESIPIHRARGDFLLSGTRNMSKELVAVVYKEQKQSSLEVLIDSISSVIEQKMGKQDKVETVVSKFVLVILVLACLGFMVSFGRLNSSLPLRNRLSQSCERAMTILVAACPCSLGLAMPSAVMAGIDAAWRRGILITGGASTLEQLAKITHLAMDKTGTLTTGRLEVASHRLLSRTDIDKDLHIQLICAAEKDGAQAHPVANAVFKWALERTRSNEILPTRNSKVVLGKGVFAEVMVLPGIWYTVHVGNEQFMVENGIELHDETRYECDVATTTVHYAVASEYCGVIALQDTVRDEAKSVIDSLKCLSIDITMLTGDTTQEANRISTALNIPVLGAQTLPCQKQAYIKELQKKGHVVAMIGDGVNDSPAQAASDVGILLSLTRSCITDAADVIIMSPNLSALPQLFHISRATIRQAKRNIQWAIFYNVTAVTLAMGLFERFGITIDASNAGAMMAFSSSTVLFMSLCLRRSLEKSTI